MEARITTAKLARDQPGRLPPGVEAEVAKIEGSRVRYQVDARGIGSGFVAEPRPGLEGGLAQVVSGVRNLLRMLHLPIPSQPVGEGAFWMVTAREPFGGLDTIAYRMFRVTKVEEATVALTVNTKRYTAGGQVDFRDSRRIASTSCDRAPKAASSCPLAIRRRAKVGSRSRCSRLSNPAKSPGGASPSSSTSARRFVRQGPLRGPFRSPALRLYDVGPCGRSRLSGRLVRASRA